MIRVTSGWHPAGSRLYGSKFLQSFDKFWPAEVELQVYTEEPEPMPRDACRSLWDIPGARELIVKTDTPRHHGRDPSFGRWKRSSIEAGYSFKFDSFKFFKQLLIPQQASLDMANGDILIWLDGDVITTAPIDERWIEKILGDADVAYLGRSNAHSEIGFWAVRLDFGTRAFLADVAAIYTSGEFESLSETHSAFCWDIARNRAMGLREKNLTPGGTGHVWTRSVLQQRMSHMKGKRKGDEK